MRGSAAATACISIGREMCQAKMAGASRVPCPSLVSLPSLACRGAPMPHTASYDEVAEVRRASVPTH